MLEYDRIDIQKGLMLIKQVCRKNVIFITIGILKTFFLSVIVMIMQKAMSFGNELNC